MGAGRRGIGVRRRGVEPAAQRRSHAIAGGNAWRTVFACHPQSAPITEQAFAGKPVALFFGFTHCPEICPTTLLEMSDWLESLGPEGAAIDAYFVTVDPERDTPQVLGEYIAPFPRITGITGDLPGISAMASAWKVYFKKQPLDGGGYTMDHTASIFLVKPDGTFQGTIAYGENAETAKEKLRNLTKG
ncbi:MAG: SCO family protein [Phyllobacteriaceae bacterium]|nr:SCO family protein [Phyllobacteriaceae bacterium]